MQTFGLTLVGWCPAVYTDPIAGTSIPGEDKQDWDKVALASQARSYCRITCTIFQVSAWLYCKYQQHGQTMSGGFWLAHQDTYNVQPLQGLYHWGIMRLRYSKLTCVSWIQSCTYTFPDSVAVAAHQTTLPTWGQIVLKLGSSCGCEIPRYSKTSSQ